MNCYAENKNAKLSRQSRTSCRCLSVGLAARQERFDEVVAMFGENRLGVKLHTFDVEDAMADSHHNAIALPYSR